MNIGTQIWWLNYVRLGILANRLALHKKHLFLDEPAKKALLIGEVVFALCERNDTTGVYIKEELALLATHFNWTPIEQVRGKRALRIEGIKEYYIPKPIAEVITELEKEFAQ